ncbi:MAG: hypothetical protein JNK84_19645 [Phreatobacter sp.]|nr:hypothetical protein [Phreatobacter sp.]MBL8571295.1 hypothetical protein [Phreatobacter sp.]
MPSIAACNRPPQALEKLPGMMSGVQNSVVLSDQFILGISADLAEASIGMNDPPGPICSGNDRRLIERPSESDELFSLKRFSNM